MPAKKDYAVGRGKPPEHTRFQKGQSGNPGGKPGPALSLHRRLQDAVEGALEFKSWELNREPTENALQEIAKTIVLGAAKGQRSSVTTFLKLAEKFDEADARENAKSSTTETTTAGGARSGETQTSSLSQGKSQGSIENATDAEGATETGSGSGSETGNGTGGDAGMATGSDAGSETESTAPQTAADAPAPSTRLNKQTIWIGGRLVQQGD